MQISFLTSLFFKKKRAPKIALPNASDPLLLATWQKVRLEFFPDRIDLDDVEIHWSRRRQKRVLASVSIRQKKVRVASELNHEEHHIWLEPLLYHEMCHAVLGENIPVRNRKRQWHGKEFKALEQLHPKMQLFESWIKAGGWARAVRSARSKSMWIHRRSR